MRPSTLPVRDWLRSLRVFESGLPSFEPDNAPDTPAALFLDWLGAAVDAGLPAAHAMTLSTSDGDSVITARTLILKDVDDEGWQFATTASSPKGRALTQNPRAALSFFWPTLGRQVKVTGTVERLSDEEAAGDFLARPDDSRAATLVGRQSETLMAPDDYRAALALAMEDVRADPRLLAPEWSVYSVRPQQVEFWQARHDRAHTRLLYRAQGTDWTKELLWP